MNRNLVALSIALMLSWNTALASDFSGFAVAIYTVTILGGYALINVSLIAFFAMVGKYKVKKFCYWHTALSLPIPLFGLVLWIIDAPGNLDSIQIVVWHILALLLGILPVFINRLRYGNEDV